MATAKIRQNPPPVEDFQRMLHRMTSGRGERVEWFEKLREYISDRQQELLAQQLASSITVPEEKELAATTSTGFQETEQKELDALRLQNERLKTLATSDRRAAARERERYEELLSRYDVLSEGIHELRRDNSKLLAKVADLCTSIRSHDTTIDVRQHFTQLVAEWKSTRGHSSKLKDLVTHPAYQQIIGIGRAAIPLLLNEMKEQPDHWDWALRAITGTDPAPQEAWGRLRQIAAAWIEWGIAEGYCN